MQNNSTITLTRRQIEHIVTHMALDQGIESVTILQRLDSGIGVGHTALFNKTQTERSFEVDITDVSIW